MDTGFIGLGTMGRAMAANLLKAGHRVRVWNRSQETRAGPGRTRRDRVRERSRGVPSRRGHLHAR